MFNRVILVGNLTRDVEVRFTPNGTAVASFGIATNRKYGDKEETFFGEITAWGKLGETCGQYLEKGSRALIDGRLTTESWEKDGKKQSKTRIVAENVRFMNNKPHQGQGAQEPPHPTVDEDIPF